MPSSESASDAIDQAEIEALLAASKAGSLPTTSAKPDTFSDEISADELADLVAASGVKMPPPITVPPPVPVAPSPVAAAPAAAPTPAPVAPAPRPAAAPPGFAPLAHSGSTAIESGLGLLMDVPLRVSVELGRISMSLQQVLALGRGSIVELERLAGEPVDILVNDKLIGRGEVVVVDENFGVKLTELIDAKG